MLCFATLLLWFGWCMLRICVHVGVSLLFRWFDLGNCLLVMILCLLLGVDFMVCIWG